MNTTMERVVTQQQIQTVVTLAKVIWTEHYTPIIGTEQVAYMLGNFHSPDNIGKEVSNPDCHYYLIHQGNEAVGYIGVKFDDKALFLSKLYLLSSERGNGLGKQAIQFLRELALSRRCDNINLTVNRHNSNTIAAYKAIGFEVTGEVCADIGNGYVMDDYQMALKL